MSWVPHLWSCTVTLLWLPPAEWESFPSGWHCPLCDRRLINTIAWTPLSLSLSFLIPQEDGVASLLHKLGGNKWDAQEQLLPHPTFDSRPAHREWGFSSAPRVTFPMRRGPARPRPGGKGYLTVGFNIRGAPSVDKSLVLICLYQ